MLIIKDPRTGKILAVISHKDFNTETILELELKSDPAEVSGSRLRKFDAKFLRWTNNNKLVLN